MSSHEELERAEAYALGALDADERRAYESHLASCQECRRAVERASVTAAAIGLTPDSVPVPKGSADRLVALFKSGAPSALPSDGDKAPGGGGAGLALLMAAATIAGLAFGGFWKNEADRQRGRAERAEAEAKGLAAKVEDCQHERAREHAATDRLDQIAQVVLDPGVRRLPLSLQKNKFIEKGSVEVAYSPTRGVAVFAKDLPAPPSGMVYKLWALKGGVPVPMRVIDVSGTGQIHLEGAVGDPNAQFAISLEAAPGDVQTPTNVLFLPRG